MRRPALRPPLVLRLQCQEVVLLLQLLPIIQGGSHQFAAPGRWVGCPGVSGTLTSCLRKRAFSCSLPPQQQRQRVLSVRHACTRQTRPTEGASRAPHTLHTVSVKKHHHLDRLRLYRTPNRMVTTWPNTPVHRAESSAPLCCIVTSVTCARTSRIPLDRRVRLRTHTRIPDAYARHHSHRHDTLQPGSPKSRLMCAAFPA